MLAEFAQKGLFLHRITDYTIYTVFSVQQHNSAGDGNSSLVCHAEITYSVMETLSSAI